MMNLNRFMMGVALMGIALTGCSNEEQLSLDGTADATTPLSISVTNADMTKVGGVVSGSQFGDGASLGLFLTARSSLRALPSSETPYDPPYDNIQYTLSTSGGNQVWTASSPILLTGTKANVYAYYPYNSNYNDITAIPIDVTENKDVMWADYASNINNANPTATLPMNHALSVIRFSLSKGDYSGDGNITSIKIKGAGMAKTGSLNAKTGAVTPTDAGTEIDLGATATLSSTPTNVEQLVIPTGSGSIQVTIQMDDKTFEATSSAPITPTQSKAYKFGLAFSDSKLTMSTVTIGTIDEVDEGNMTPVIRYVPTTITWAEAKATDGVYGIYEGKPAVYNEAKKADEGELEGVAIVMYGRALQISNSILSISWGDNTVNISGITEVTVVGGGVTISAGCLPKPNGSYVTSTESYQIKQAYNEWPNSPGTALADTCGWSNTEALIAAQGSDYLGGATTTFRNGSSNQGYKDWFVPSAAQLAYIYMNHDKINELLPKCGGTALPTDWYHWSSSEYSASHAWYVNFSSGYVERYNKNLTSYVQFCRYITE